LVKDKI
jgi:serine/threonine protein kinase